MRFRCLFNVPFMVLFITLSVALPTVAHEVRPAYLDLYEQSDGTVHILWKTPMRGDLRLGIKPVFTAKIDYLSPASNQLSGSAAIQRWSMHSSEPLRGQTLLIDGLNSTMTDVLVQAEFADGSHWTARLTPSAAQITIPASSSPLSVAKTYTALGIEHILLGIDHLLFVLTLIMLAKKSWPLLKTITAFTLAHSITLALTTLDYIHIPVPPVEALIALSIAFVSIEIIHAYRGQASGISKSPWIMAFIFGLLHGLGFASALSEIGLPQGQIPVALLFFNVGVELGQLLFVASVFMLFYCVKPIITRLPKGSLLVPPYIIGIFAMFWVCQRLVSF